MAIHIHHHIHFEDEELLAERLVCIEAGIKTILNKLDKVLEGLPKEQALGELSETLNDSTNELKDSVDKNRQQ